MENGQNIIFHIQELIACPHCGWGFKIVPQISFAYFHGTNINCPNCNKAIDWWSTILNNVKLNAFLFQTLAPVGAQALAISLKLSPKNAKVINFEDYGIPKDAKILDIIYNINVPLQDSGLFPLEFYGNHPPRHTILHSITLYPVPLPGMANPKETPVQVMVTWVPHTADDESWQNLVDAFEAYSQNRFQACIIPANVAVESKLSRLLTHYLGSIASKENIEDFLENGATYSHQLNVVLPLILKGSDIPILPNNIRGLLNRLRSLRNTLAHDGKLDKELEKNEVAELIVAALFGFHYLMLVNKKLGG